MSPSRTSPPNRWFATEARPAEAMQPHSEQTGLPPNWQGVDERE